MIFVINDTTQINEYGFYVENAGIAIDEFLQNPVCLYEHNSEDAIPAIGTWGKFKVEGSQLLAELTFDSADNFALELKRKYEAGIMRACSKAFVIEDYELIDMGGRIVPKVTKCRLKEISLVNVGANPKSLKVKLSMPGAALAKGDIVKLGYSASENVTTAPAGVSNNSNPIKMKKVFLALGISESATEEQAESALNKLLSERSDLQKQFDEFKAKVQAEKVESLISEGIKAKKITALEGEKFKKLALADYDSVKDIIDAKEAYKPVKEQIEEANAKLHEGTQTTAKERPKEFVPKGKGQKEYFIGLSSKKA
jgi:hypothetical protein